MPRTTDIFTRTGGHSAKNVHQSGAPYPQQTSGETAMVGSTHTLGERTVSAIRNQISGQSHRFLFANGQGRLGANFDRLADLVAEICAEQTAQLRAERAALWQLLKDQTRSVYDLCAEVGELETVRWSLVGELAAVETERGCSA